jgi:Flp pilus assembly protein TadG
MGAIARLQARRRRDAGTAAIEFALLGPLLLALLGAAAELGFAMYQTMQVYNAAEAGMMYAAKNGWNQTGIASAVANATNLSGVTATPAPLLFCGCPATSGITTVTCTTPLPTCASGNSAEYYIQVSAALTRVSLFSYSLFGLPATLTAQSILRRVQ